MREQHLIIKLFERWLHENYSTEIANAPINSMTPFLISVDRKEEFIFVVKGEHWLYEPLENKTIHDKVKMGVSAYTEGSSLIFRINVEPDIVFESEIPANKIKSFLKCLKQQETMTVVVVDHVTMNIVWLTNDYPFWKVRHQFEPFYAHYGI